MYQKAPIPEREYQGLKRRYIMYTLDKPCIRKKSQSLDSGWAIKKESEIGEGYTTRRGLKRENGNLKGGVSLNNGHRFSTYNEKPILILAQIILKCKVQGMKKRKTIILRGEG